MPDIGCYVEVVNPLQSWAFPHKTGIRKKENIVADGDKREILFLTSSQLENANRHMDSERRSRSDIGKSSFINHAIKLLNTSPDYTFGLLGKLASPNRLFYTDNRNFIDPINESDATYLLRLFGINIGIYFQLFREGGVLFIVGNEPESEKRQRLLNELERNTDRSTYGYDIKLGFLIGITLNEIFLSRNIAESAEQLLMDLFLDYQLKINQQVILATLSSPKDQRGSFAQYQFCEREREALFAKITSLGWGLPIVDRQVYDIRFREWNTEKENWNLGKVSVVFQKR